MFVFLAVVICIYHFVAGIKLIDGIVFLVVAVFIILTSLTEKKQEAVGVAKFHDNFIRIETINDAIDFDLGKDVCVKINYSGYMNKRMIGDFIPNYNHYSGTDNYLVIIENKSYVYSFLVEDEQQEAGLLNLVGYWKSQNFNIHYNN